MKTHRFARMEMMFGRMNVLPRGLAVAIAALCLPLAVPALAQKGAAQDQPNILVIWGDDIVVRGPLGKSTLTA